MDTYTVLIGDILDSRSLSKEARRNSQRKLKAVLESINADSCTIASPATITLGDEFQVVYNNADDVFPHIWKVMAEMLPVQMRFGIGLGAITTEINERQAIGMDGPAFHNARQAIENSKAEEQRISIHLQERNNDPILQLMNASLQMIDHEMRSWKDRRYKLLSRYFEGLDYKEVSTELGISIIAFYKNLEAGAIDEIINTSKIITKLLNRISNEL